MNKQRLDFKHHWPHHREGRRSRLEKKAQHIGNISSRYLHKQTLSTLCLLAGTLVAIIWASFPAIANQYDAFTNLLIGVHISKYSFKKPLTFWVNDILICLFFFLVGLEIKKEILVGKLNQPRLALFAVFGGIGGMVVPALLFFLANYQTDFSNAWGIPMATDTAIVLSILIFFKDKLPKGLFAFLATLAIIDDIGAILVIAVFYTQTIDILMLLYSGILILTLVLLNLSGVRQAFVYFVLGFLLWACVELAGFHGTLAGLMVALAIPARPVNKSKVFVKRAKRILHELDAHTQKEDQVLKHEIHHELLEHMRHYTHQASTPLQKWENQLELPIFLIILPLFALVNAGIPVSKDLFCHMFTNTLSIGIILGLVIGKPLGIVSFCWTALKTNIGEMPEGSDFRHILGVSALSGIGFTMSIFITNQCVNNESMVLQAKASVMVASIASAFLAIFCIKRMTNQ